MTFIEEARLRAVLRQTQQDLQHAEAELATRMTEIRNFDTKIERRLGVFETELEILETEITLYRSKIHQIQQAQASPEWSEPARRGDPHKPLDHQAARASPTIPPPESELRTLYRDLARRYHPDTAFDDLDRQYRHEMMLRINEAYANGDFTELHKHARGMVHVPIRPENPQPPRYGSSLEQVEAELVACQARLRETRAKIEKLRFHPSVQLSLNVKLAWRQGKDLIGEMAKELQEKIDQKTIERDTLVEELNQLN